MSLFSLSKEEKRRREEKRRIEVEVVENGDDVRRRIEDAVFTAQRRRRTAVRRNTLRLRLQIPPFPPFQTLLLPRHSLRGTQNLSLDNLI